MHAVYHKVPYFQKMIHILYGGNFDKCPFILSEGILIPCQNKWIMAILLFTFKAMGPGQFYWSN